MPCELLRFEAFFELLPRSVEAAASLVAQHTTRSIEDGALPDRPARAALRCAVEVRTPACLDARFMALLRKHRIAWVIADSAGRFPYSEEVTVDFVYVRLHGDTKLYASGYGPRAIARWAERIERWSSGGEPKDAAHLKPAARRRSRDVNVYFDNDGSAHAPHDAVALQEALAKKPALSRRLQR